MGLGTPERDALAFFQTNAVFADTDFGPPMQDVDVLFTGMRPTFAGARQLHDGRLDAALFQAALKNVQGCCAAQAPYCGILLRLVRERTGIELGEIEPLVVPAAVDGIGQFVFKAGLDEVVEMKAESGGNFEISGSPRGAPGFNLHDRSLADAGEDGNLADAEALLIADTAEPRARENPRGLIPGNDHGR